MLLQPHHNLGNRLASDELNKVLYHCSVHAKCIIFLILHSNRTLAVRCKSLFISPMNIQCNSYLRMREYVYNYNLAYWARSQNSQLSLWKEAMVQVSLSILHAMYLDG